MFCAVRSVHFCCWIKAYLCSQVIFASTSSFFVQVYAPFAFHTGIPEIKTILGGYIITDFLSGPTLLIKSLGLVSRNLEFRLDYSDARRSHSPSLPVSRSGRRVLWSTSLAVSGTLFFNRSRFCVETKVNQFDSTILIRSRHRYSSPTGDHRISSVGGNLSRVRRSARRSSLLARGNLNLLPRIRTVASFRLRHRCCSHTAVHRSILDGESSAVRGHDDVASLARIRAHSLDLPRCTRRSALHLPHL